jgi:hypothetical protein
MTSPCHRSLGSREQGVPETKGNEHSDMVVTRQGAVATHLEAKEGSTRSADPSFFFVLGGSVRDDHVSEIVFSER